MSFTVSAMDTQLSYNLGDPNGERWSHAKRMVALNAAQRDVVNMVLGTGSREYPTFGELTVLQAQSNISIETDGYALNGLDTTPGAFLGEQGFIRARGSFSTDQTKTFDMIHVSPQSGEAGDNWYMQGSTVHPMIRFEGNKVFAEIDTANYPVTVDFVYIRQPKTLVTDGVSGYSTSNCDVNATLHDCVIRLAEAYCRRMGDDFEQYAIIRQEVIDDVVAISRGYQATHNRSRNTFEEK